MKNKLNSVIIQGVSLEELTSLIAETIESKLNRLKSPPSENIDYLTRKETADLLRISLPTLHLYTRNGQLKGYKISSKILYKRDEIEASLVEIEALKYKRA
jgi:hypothetical protein